MNIIFPREEKHFFGLKILHVCDADPGSGIFLALDPGSGMGKKSRSGSGMNIPDHNSERLETSFGVENTSHF